MEEQQVLVNQEELAKVMGSCEADVDYLLQLSNEQVKKYTKDLDDLMKDILDEVVGNENVSDDIIEKYFLELTSALYFISSKCETLGFYEDTSKLRVGTKYNDSFVQNQIEAANAGKKTTVKDNEIAAETASLDEKLVNIVFSRSNKVIKTKIEAANEMVKTLSKILSKHMADKDYSNRVNPDEVFGDK